MFHLFFLQENRADAPFEDKEWLFVLEDVSITENVKIG